MALSSYFVNFLIVSSILCFHLKIIIGFCREKFQKLHSAEKSEAL